jgi:hypothetical protein
VGADEPGDNDFPTTVKDVVAVSFRNPSFRKDLLDPVAFDEKVGLFQNLPLGIHGDDRGVL